MHVELSGRQREVEEKKITTSADAATPQCKCSRVSMLRNVNLIHALTALSIATLKYKYKLIHNQATLIVTTRV